MPHPRRAIPLDQWPETDRPLWKKATLDADPLFEPGAASRWRPKTLHTVITRYGLWLAWLAEMGLLDPTASPSARATSEHLARYVRYLQARGIASVTIAGYIRDLREAIRVMEPEANLANITDLLVRLDAMAEPSRNKRLRVVSSALLFEAGIREMERLHKRRPSRDLRHHAAKYRDALIIALLALRPIRLENLSAIEIDRHLMRIEHLYWCRFATTETKEKRRLEFPLPEPLTPWMELYLQVYRPLLLRNRSLQQIFFSLRST
jgi:site-specific recombinase XerD